MNCIRWTKLFFNNPKYTDLIGLLPCTLIATPMGMRSAKFLIGILLFFTGCECEQDSLEDFDGIGGISFEIDGSRPDSIFRKRLVRFQDNPDSGNLLFQISYDGAVDGESVFIGLDIAPINQDEFQGKTFELTEFDTERWTTAEGSLRRKSTRFTTTDIHRGEVTISFFDSVEGIVSGTFWFDAEDFEGNMVQVRDGFFDVTYNTGNSSSEMLNK